MSRLIIAIGTIAALLCGLANAQAGIVVTVDKSAQRLTVTVDGAGRYEWPVSTARIGYMTPNGSYRPERLERQWFSRKYDWSPMPYSIFFDGGYAIHGSYEISRLGRPASHGCIRLHPKNAAILFALVQQNVSNTRIVVTGEGYMPMVRERGEGYVTQVRDRGESRRARNNFQSIFNSADEPVADVDLARQRWENRN
jgi:hypothetical protein